MKNFFLFKNLMKELKQILFTVPNPSLPTRYIEMLREMKKSPIKLRQSFYFSCVYVWNIQQKMTVSDIVCYSSVDDPLGLQLPFKGEKDKTGGGSFQLDAKKQVKLKIESLYRPNTWTQITTSLPFRIALGGGIFVLYLQTNFPQNSKSLNYLSQINTKLLSSMLTSFNNKSDERISNFDLTVYGNDWLVINGEKKLLTEESGCFSLSKANIKNSIYLRKLTRLLDQSPQATPSSVTKEIPLYVPVDLGFQNNNTDYYYRQFNFCKTNSINERNISKIEDIKQSKWNIEDQNQLSHHNSFFYDQRYDTTFLSFQILDKLLIYGILPFLFTRIWLAPSFVLWWSYKFDAEKKKEIKKNIKKIQQTEFVKISKFIERTVTFRDVGGMENLKKELKTVAFLLRNKNYSSPHPTGYIFAGPPGTGKTLMAKAMAYEAQTPYIYVEGYQFQDEEKGIANARVDDLFNQIRGLSPCILYIDEIDSIGERRDNKNDRFKVDESLENNNNKGKPSDTVFMQFLLYMDGFKTKGDVIIIGATNRLEILDDALLRPGRFDRQILFSPPLFKERIDILKIFLSKSLIPFSNTSIEELAQRSMGFNGCDLRLLADNLLFLSTYGQNNSISSSQTNSHLDQAFERISRVRYKITNYETTFNKKDFARTACHEIGKALIHILLPQSVPIYSIQLFPKPFNDRFLEIERKNIRVPSIDLISTNNSDYLLQKIVALVAGRAAECAFFDENLDDISTYLNRSFDPNLYVASQTSHYMIELGLFDSTNGIIQDSENNLDLEERKEFFFTQIYRFVKEKALLKVTRELRKTVKFDFQKPFLPEFWYEQDYVWEFDFIQQNKVKGTKEYSTNMLGTNFVSETPLMAQLDIQTVYTLHTLFQYTYDFLKSNIRLLDYLTFLLLKEKQLSYQTLIKVIADFNREVPEKSWKAW